MLAQKASFLLETGTCPSPYRVLALSYKRDAAKNLRDRVVQRSGSELAQRFDSYTFDAFSKMLVDRFRKGLPDLYRPSTDYQIDTKSKPRDLLNELPPREGLTLDDVQRVSVQDFQQIFVYGTDYRPDAVDKNSFVDKIARAFWHYMLHEYSPSRATFWMINRLANLLLLRRASLLAALRQTYPYVFLDEFQDTTGLQYELLQTMFACPKVNVTAVGDHKQRIMAWAGAFDGVFAKFMEDFHATDYRLSSNYRSSPLLLQIQHQIAIALEGRDAVLAIAGSQHSAQGYCEALSFADDAQEGRIYRRPHRELDCARSVGSPTDLRAFRRFVANATANLISALADRHISGRVEDRFQDLLAEPITRLLLNVLRLISEKRAPESWSRTLETLCLMRGAESDNQERVVESELSDFLHSLRTQAFPGPGNPDAMQQLIHMIVEFLDREAVRLMHPPYSQGEHLDGVLNSFASCLSECCVHGNPVETLNAFEGKSSIPMMTIHKSKGLEFDAVIFIGLEDEEIAYYKANPREETCNFFVALSRARQRVVFTTCQTRSIGRRLRHTDDVQPLYDLLQRAGIMVKEIP